MRPDIVMDVGGIYDPFQYRSRVTPFAAGEAQNWYTREGVVSIPQQGYPLCG